MSPSQTRRFWYLGTRLAEMDGCRVLNPSCDSGEGHPESFWAVGKVRNLRKMAVQVGFTMREPSLLGVKAAHALCLSSRSYKGGRHKAGRQVVEIARPGDAHKGYMRRMKGLRWRGFRSIRSTCGCSPPHGKPCVPRDVTISQSHMEAGDTPLLLTGHMIS